MDGLPCWQPDPRWLVCHGRRSSLCMTESAVPPTVETGRAPSLAPPPHGAAASWRRGPLAPQLHDPGLLSAYMASRDQVVRNGPRLVWLGSLRLGVAHRHA